MRIREGDYAYDLEQKVDPSTMLRHEWIYRVYVTVPTDQVLEQGEAETREAAEKRALRAIARFRSAQSAA